MRKKGRSYALAGHTTPHLLQGWALQMPVCEGEYLRGRFVGLHTAFRRDEGL